LETLQLAADQAQCICCVCDGDLPTPYIVLTKGKPPSIICTYCNNVLERTGGDLTLLTEKNRFSAIARSAAKKRMNGIWLGRMIELLTEGNDPIPSPEKKAPLTGLSRYRSDDARLEAAEQWGWLHSRAKWGQIDGAWWEICKEARMIHIRVISDGQFCRMIADSQPAAKQFGDSTHALKARLSELDMPGKAYAVGVERIELKCVPFSQIDVVVSLLRQLVQEFAHRPRVFQEPAT